MLPAFYKIKGRYYIVRALFQNAVEPFRYRSLLLSRVRECSFQKPFRPKKAMHKKQHFVMKLKKKIPTFPSYPAQCLLPTKRTVFKVAKINKIFRKKSN